MGRKPSALKRLEGPNSTEHTDKTKDRIAFFLPKADKMSYVYLCKRKGTDMSKDLTGYISRVIKREKKNIPEKIKDKIREIIQKEMKS